MTTGREIDHYEPKTSLWVKNKSKRGSPVTTKNCSTKIRKTFHKNSPRSPFEIHSFLYLICRLEQQYKVPVFLSTIVHKPARMTNPPEDLKLRRTRPMPYYRSTRHDPGQEMDQTSCPTINGKLRNPNPTIDP